MILTSRKNIRTLLKKRKIYPSKRFGQNFLVDKKILSKIIKVSNLKRRDVVLEIGPGVGTLTQELAKKVKKVVAVEKDQKMCEILKETLKNFKNIKIIQGDILKLDPKPYLPATPPASSREASRAGRLSSRLWQAGTLKPYKVVANLPYYIVSPVIRKFLESKNPPKEMILMVQKEVAQRICACPPKLKERRRAKPPHLYRGFGGQAKMSLLAVSVQFYAKAEIIFFVSKKSFWPQPKVDGAIIRVTINRKQRTVNKKLFFKIVKAGFSQPRKQIINSLSTGLALNLPNGLALSPSNRLKLNKPHSKKETLLRGKEKIKNWLLKNKIKPSQRAETLSIKDWIRLTKSYIIIQ